MIDKETFHSYFLQLIPISRLSLHTQEQLHSYVTTEYHFLVNVMQSEKRAQHMQQRMAVYNAPFEDFQLKHIQCGNIELLTSLRFRGMHPDKPFVDIEYMNSTLQEFVSHFSILAKEVVSQYHRFPIKDITVWTNEENHSEVLSLKGEEDFSFYAIPVLEVPKFEDDVFKIEIADRFTEEDYSRYCNEYDMYLNKHPEIIGNVSAEPLETIQKKCEEKQCYKIWVNKEWAGMIILTPHIEYFLEGYLVWDKIIFETFRGKHLSSKALSYIIHHLLDAKASQWLYGRIDLSNTSSLKSASYLHRSKVLTKYKLHI